MSKKELHLSLLAQKISSTIQIKLILGVCVTNVALQTLFYFSRLFCASNDKCNKPVRGLRKVNDLVLVLANVRLSLEKTRLHTRHLTYLVDCCWPYAELTI